VITPALCYGTAWKEERTRDLVTLALAAGFRAIDTANQRRHYHEAGVGEALAVALGEGRIGRGDLFLQSKFTDVAGQDHRLPYDPRAPLGEQVTLSFASSLAHLGTTYLDAYLLHGPSTRAGLSDEDWQIWQAMEGLHRAGLVGSLGVSNVTAAQLALLLRHATIPPAFVQNRCYARTGWDRPVREVAAARGVRYQGFSLLTANRRELGGAVIAAIAARHQRSAAQIVFRFAIEVGMLPLTGTSSPQHMREDLDVLSFGLAPDEVRAIERVAG
jgi:diketogulonate reductase-like aldo/keto reductase